MGSLQLKWYEKLHKIPESQAGIRLSESSGDLLCRVTPGHHSPVVHTLEGVPVFLSRIAEHELVSFILKNQLHVDNPTELFIRMQVTRHERHRRRNYNFKVIDHNSLKDRQMTNDLG